MKFFKTQKDTDSLSNFKTKELSKRQKILQQTFFQNYRTCVISVLAITLALVVDGVVVGQFLGTVAIAAYGIAFPITAILNAIFSIFSTGMQSLCANYMARGDTKLVNWIFNSTIILGLLFSIGALILILLFIDPLSNLLCATNTSENPELLIADVKGYIIGISLGIPLEFGARLLSPLMQLDSDRNRVYFATILGTTINISLDIISVFFTDFGIFGIGLATSISFVGELVVYLFHFNKKDTIFKLNVKLAEWAEMNNTLWVGLPAAFGYICSTIRSVFLNSYILIIGGSLGVAAMAVQNNSMIFFSSILVGLGTVTKLFANMYVGENDTTSLKHLFSVSMFTNFVIIGGVALLIIIFAPFLTMIYTQDPELTPMVITAIRILAISMPISGFTSVIQGYSQANKKIILTIIVSFLDVCILIVPTVILLGTNFGMMGVWIAFPLSSLLVIPIYLIYTMIRTRKIKITLNDILFIENQNDQSKFFEYTVQNEEDLMMTCVGAEALCMKNSIDSKRSKVLNLCLEEMGANIITHGIKDSDNLFVDIKITIKEDDIIIRLRDNCEAFNPIDHHKQIDPDDLMSGMGIKMVFKMAKDVNYISSFKLNNLVITI